VDCRGQRNDAERQEGARAQESRKEGGHSDGCLRMLWEPTVLSGGVNSASSCDHTVVLPRIPQDGPAVSFMNHIAGKGFFDRATRSTGADPVIVCFQSLRDLPNDVLAEESERSLAIDLLLRFYVTFSFSVQ